MQRPEWRMARIGLLFAACAATAFAGESVTSSAQPVPRVPGAHDFTRLLGRGVNMGNALDAPKEGAWGVTIQKEYFSLIRRAGFHSVRIPIRWNAHADMSPPYAISDAFFQRVDEVIGMAVAEQLAVVINVHHYEELMKEPEAHGPRLVSLWTQIAQRYQSQPDTVAFELLNEPHDQLTPEKWNVLLKQLVAELRETNPRRPLIVGTAEWGGLGGLDALELPRGDTNLIVTFHYYNPFQFTHQGAEWAQNSGPWLGTRWEGDEAQRRAIEADFDRAVRWAADHGVPLYLGEFGAYRKADMDSRARWTAFVARSAEARGIPWAYWEFCAGFGVYDAARGAWIDPLRNALIPKGGPTTLGACAAP